MYFIGKCLETIGHHVKGNKPDREKQILHAVSNIFRVRIYSLLIKECVKGKVIVKVNMVKVLSTHV
jgi:hypothetical protein